jgi:hypothetical protein
MPISPFLNAAVFNRGMPQRGAIVKPHLGNFGKKPAVVPVQVNNGEILSKLAKIIPEFNNAEKAAINAKIFIDLLSLGLNKQTAPNFYAGLETLAANIGKEEFNQQALWRVFYNAFIKRYLFSANSTHVENITKWKKETDRLTNSNKSDNRKRDLNDAPAASPNAAAPSAVKRARTTPSFSQKSYNIVDVGLQVEVLQEELVAVKEELKALRDQHKRELDVLYQHLGLTPPAPPSPEPEPEPEMEPDQFVVVPESAETAENAGSTEGAEASTENTETTEHVENAEGSEKVGEIEMAEPVSSETNV